MCRNKCIQKHIVNDYWVNLIITVITTEVDTRKTVPATAIKLICIQLSELSNGNMKIHPNAIFPIAGLSWSCPVLVF